MTCVLADIGATNTRCAIVGADGMPTAIQVFENRNFSNLPELLTRYIDALPAPGKPECGIFAVAAPIRGDTVQMINIDWQFSVESLRQSLHMERLELLNDFEALAIGLPSLGSNELIQVGSGTSDPNRPKAVLGPGSGLGVASLIPAGDGWQAVSGEGGHVTLPAVDDSETVLIGKILARFRHCSSERLLSGPGLELVHSTLHESTAVSWSVLSSPEIISLVDSRP